MPPPLELSRLFWWGTMCTKYCESHVFAWHYCCLRDREWTWQACHGSLGHTKLTSCFWSACGSIFSEHFTYVIRCNQYSAGRTKLISCFWSACRSGCTLFRSQRYGVWQRDTRAQAFPLGMRSTSTCQDQASCCKMEDSWYHCAVCAGVMLVSVQVCAGLKVLREWEVLAENSDSTIGEVFHGLSTGQIESADGFCRP